MARGGFRPGSGPMPGTKYKPRTKPNKPRVKKVGVAKVVEVDKVDNVDDIIIDKIVKKRGRPRKPVVVVDTPAPIIPQTETFTPPLTSKLSSDILDAAALENLTPLEYMLRVMNNPKEDANMRARMAVSAAPYLHPRKGEASVGKKDEQAEKAKSAGAGKFAPIKTPLSLVK